MLIPNEALITFEVAWAGASKVTPDLTSCQPPCPLVRVEFHKYRLPVPPRPVRSSLHSPGTATCLG